MDDNKSLSPTTEEFRQAADSRLGLMIWMVWCYGWAIFWFISAQNDWWLDGSGRQFFYGIAIGSFLLGASSYRKAKKISK